MLSQDGLTLQLSSMPIEPLRGLLLIASGLFAYRLSFHCE